MNQNPLHFEMKKVFPQRWKPERLTYQKKKKIKRENQDSEREKSASNQIIKEN